MPAPSKMKPAAKMPRLKSVEELRAFLVLTNYLIRQFVESKIIIISPLTNILLNKTFATKRVRKLPIPWTQEQEGAFSSLKSLASPTVLVLPDWNRPLTLHTDTSFVDAGAVLTQIAKKQRSRNYICQSRFFEDEF